MRWLLLVVVGCGPTTIVEGGPKTDPELHDTDPPPAPPDDCDGRPGAVFCDLGTAVACDAAGDIASETVCEDQGQVCFDDEGCGACAPTLRVAYADPAAQETLGVALAAHSDAVALADFGWQKVRMRPVTIESARPTGVVTLSADVSGLDLYQDDGALVPLPALLDASTLPRTLWMDASARGDAVLSASWSDTVACPTPASVRVRRVSPDTLVGSARDDAPYFRTRTAVHDTDPVTVALDPARHGDRAGLPYDVYVVAHRDPAAWAADPTLTDVTEGVETATIAATDLRDALVTAAERLDAGDGLGVGYDVVLDFGQDGRLDPGDILDGLGEDQPALWVLGDLTEAGPHTPEQFDYDGGRWLLQRIYYPAEIAALGPVPLVVISHGNGHDYRWYDYLGEHLASWGYVVMAHSNETAPGIETASETTLDNTDHLLAEVDAISGGVLTGMIDGDRIAWVGHSRGGEGVVRAYDKLVDGDSAPDMYTADDIALIISIAPTVFYTVEESDPHDVPYFLIAGTADGDVTGGADCPQCQFFRLSGAAEGPVQTAYVHGADHNDFNCCGFEDAVGPKLIGSDEAQTIAKGYFLAMIQAYVDGNPATLSYVRTMYEDLHPQGLGDDRVAITYRDAPVAGTPVLDDFQGEDDNETASSGAAITTTLSHLREGRLADTDAVFAWDAHDPFNGMTWAVYDTDPARGAIFDWNGDSPSWEVAVPTEWTDVTGYGALSLAVAQGTRHAYTTALDGDLDFTVTLVDAAGVESSVNFSDIGAVPTPYPRTGLGDGAGWANEFVTVRIPLVDFELGSTLDLSALVAVRLEFGDGFGSASGRIGLDNVEFSP